MNERFRHCISMTKMLNSENLLADSGLDPSTTAITSDRILYNYAMEQCQSAALDELFGNPGECFQVCNISISMKYLPTISLNKFDRTFNHVFKIFLQRYHGAHVLLHALQYQTQNEEDKNALAVYKEAVEKRLHILEEQGFVMAYQTLNN